jgi:ThiF family protein
MSEPTSTLNPSSFAEFWSRNLDIIQPEEQDALRAARVMCAGCGTVGGSVAEPLVRMGVCAFVLADPEVYELSNLNRQMCTVADVGRPKVDVVRDRLAAINPSVSAMTLPEGLTTENIEDALKGVTVVFEGVDAFTSLWMKYLTHREAAKRRIPVLSGVDYGGQPVVYVWDYRRNPRPFYGKATENDHREGRVQESLSWLGYRQMPTDFLPVIADRLSTGRPWPQVVYCGDALGALGSRTIVDVICGRPVRDVVKVDLHDRPRRTIARIGARARWPLVGIRTLAQVKGPLTYRSNNGDTQAAWDGVPEGMLVALGAMRHAPSVHNTQPWLLGISDTETIRMRLVGSRTLDVIDSGKEGAHYSLGCAIEAAAAVAEVDFAIHPDPHPADELADVGELTIGATRTADYPRAVGLLRWRRTNRASFLTDPLEPHLLDELRQAAECHDVSAGFIADPAGIGRIAAISAEATIASTEDDAELDELLRWIRIGSRAANQHRDGFTEKTLQLDPATASGLALLQRSRRARQLAARFGLARAMAAQATQAITASGALMLLTHSDSSPAGCIAAGRGMLAAWLAATDLNIAWQPVNQALVLQRRIADVRDEFAADKSSRPLAIVRLGRARRPAPAAPRLPLERICFDERRKPAP